MSGDVELRWYEVVHLDHLTGGALRDLVPLPEVPVLQDEGLAVARLVGARRLVRRGLVVAADGGPIVDPVLLVLLDLLASPHIRIVVGLNGRTAATIALGDGLGLVAWSTIGPGVTLRPVEASEVASQMLTAVGLSLGDGASEALLGAAGVYELRVRDEIADDELRLLRWTAAPAGGALVAEGMLDPHERGEPTTVDELRQRLRSILTDAAVVAAATPGRMRSG